MKKIITFAVAALPVLACAQSITPEVVASAGDHYENGNVQLSWTLGEVAVQTLDNGTNIITEGFHQNDITITSIEEISELEMDVNVFPNPTQHFINLEFSNNQNQVTAVLFDMNGKEISRMDVDAFQMEAGIDVSDLAAGGYLLRLTEENGKFTSTHQIHKVR